MGQSELRSQALPICGMFAITTLRTVKRLFTELPQPARTFQRCFIGFFLGTFLLLVITRVNWFALRMSAAGIFLFLFGLHIFRDLKGTASTWSEIHKERRGISPDVFTFADVPTIKGVGFIYMIMGLFFAVGASGFLSRNRALFPPPGDGRLRRHARWRVPLRAWTLTPARLRRPNSRPCILQAACYLNSLAHPP